MPRPDSPLQQPLHHLRRIHAGEAEVEAMEAVAQLVAVETDEQREPAIEKIEILTRKWAKENDYRLKKTLWAFNGNRIAVRFEYEWHDDAGQWWRSHGNENWEFDENGYMAKR